MTNNYRYPGSRSFEEKDAALFFGRKKETIELFNLINVEKMVSVFARSGIGKTSLIQAGLLPMLDNTAFFPVFIRFNDLNRSPIAQFREQYGKAIGADLTENATIWEQIKQYPVFKQGKTAQPLLILDQFEELFTLHTPEKRQDFLQNFADLANGRIPDLVQQKIRTAILNDEDIPDAELAEMERAPIVSIIIAIRSDFLHLLDEVSKQIPNILRTRIQLAALNPKQAEDAILRPAALENAAYQCPIFSFEPQAIQDILRHLQNQHQEIESFQLQILCRYIEEKRIKTGTKLPVNIEFYGGKAGIQSVLNNFYHNKIAEIAENKQLFARKMIEEGLITESERRRSAEENDLIKNYGIDIPVLNMLVEGRLLRKEPRLDSHYYEISHDTLVQPILMSYKTRKSEEDAAHQAQELARLKAEQAKQAAALAEEKRRTDEQAKLRKRATLFAWGAGILAVVAVVVGMIALDNADKAKKAKITSDTLAAQAKRAQKNDSISTLVAQEEARKAAAAANIAKIAQENDSISKVKAETEKDNAEKRTCEANKAVLTFLYSKEKEVTRKKEIYSQNTGIPEMQNLAQIAQKRLDSIGIEIKKTEAKTKGCK